VKTGEILSTLKKDGRDTYFLGSGNYFNPMLDDRQSERFVLASLMYNGHVRACGLEAEPLTIPHRALLNWVAQYRSDGPAVFFRTSNGRKTQIMTD
jgi:hypothetical protein